MNGKNQTTAQSASGLELAPHLAQQIPTQLLVALHLLPYLTVRPRVYLEDNGRGEKHHVLRYAIPRAGRPRKREAMYLGRLRGRDLCLLLEQLDEHQTQSSQASILRQFAPQIERIRGRRSAARAAAQEQAHVCGFYLRGYAIHRRRSPAPRTVRKERKRRDLGRLKSILRKLQVTNCQFFMLTLLEFISLSLLAWPHISPSKAEKRAMSGLRSIKDATERTARALKRVAREEEKQDETRKV